MKGVHRVKSRFADGRRVEYHYAWRGGPRFWTSIDGPGDAGGAEYLAALAAVARPANHARGLFREILIAFLDSAEFAGLAARTQKDLRISIYHPKTGIEVKWGSAPRALFDDARVRPQVLAWRDRLGGKTGDTRAAHLRQIVGWAHDRGLLSEHRLTNIRATYKADRAEIIWTDDEIATFTAGAPAHVARILIAATETGLRPGDLHQLSLFHIEKTPHGRRILLRTAKRRRIASIPVTPRMAALIDATTGERLLTTANGTPWRNANYLGDAVSTWRDELGIRKELRLYDARGTAATRWLNMGLELREIATIMGWSIKHAAQVIETYVALHPSMTDKVLARLPTKRT